MNTNKPKSDRPSDRPNRKPSIKSSDTVSGISSGIINFLHYILGMIFNFAIMAVVIFAVYYLTVEGFNYGTRLAAEMVAGGEYYEMEFVLDYDTPATEFSRELEYHGIISNRHLFNLEVFLMGGVRVYEAGTYTLNRNMSNSEIRRVMRGASGGLAPHEDITIPEGWTIAQMAEYFEYRGFFPAEEFIYVAHYIEPWRFSFSFLMGIPLDRPNGLEGYLFPDTYQIPLNPAPGDIIFRMLRRFDQIFDVDLRNMAEDLGMTVDEAVVMASIIEMESRLAHERPMISGIIHNRLAIDMRLQMCSTVKYTMDDPPIRLSVAQTQVDTPFNTYVHAGLPIGPITNPGAAALRAAVNPANHDYIFFVLYNFDTGEHFFSRTAEEHGAADERARNRAAAADQ